jgi:hypothetical protein
MQDQRDFIDWLRAVKINYAGFPRKAMEGMMKVWEACGSPHTFEMPPLGEVPNVGTWQQVEMILVPWLKEHGYVLRVNWVEGKWSAFVFPENSESIHHPIVDKCIIGACLKAAVQGVSDDSQV